MEGLSNERNTDICEIRPISNNAVDATKIVLSAFPVNILAYKASAEWRVGMRSICYKLDTRSSVLAIPMVMVSAVVHPWSSLARDLPVS